MERLLQATSNQDLKALAAGASTKATAGVDWAIASEIEARIPRLQKAFEQGVARLTGGDAPNPRTNIKGVTGDLAAATSTLTLLREYADTCGRSMRAALARCLRVF